MTSTRSATIAVVCHSHPSVSKGGAEISAHALFQGLLEAGENAIFICACSFGDRARLAFSSEREFAVFYDPTRYEHFYHLSPKSVEQQLLSILVDQQAEIVSFHHFLNFGLNSLRAANSLPGTRCFLTLHEYLAICHHHGQMVTRPAQTLCHQASYQACTDCFPDMLRTQFAMRRATMLDAFGSYAGFISPSQFLADRYIKWGLAADRIAVIENGLLRVPASRRPPKTDDIWTFGYFGQINPFKGMDVLLDAAQHIARDRLLRERVRIRVHGNLVGQPAIFLDRFNAATRSISFLSYKGPYSSDMVCDLMNECDYVIVPSRWWENSPVVIQEAFAAQAPVLCSGIGGLAEKVRDGVSGLHFKLAEAADLARAIRSASHPSVYEQLRSGVPTVSSAFQMAKEYIQRFAAPTAGAFAKE